MKQTVALVGNPNSENNSFNLLTGAKQHVEIGQELP